MLSHEHEQFYVILKVCKNICCCFLSKFSDFMCRLITECGRVFAILLLKIICVRLFGDFFLSLARMATAVRGTPESKRKKSDRKLKFNILRIHARKSLDIFDIISPFPVWEELFFLLPFLPCLPFTHTFLILLFMALPCDPGNLLYFSISHSPKSPSLLSGFWQLSLVNKFYFHNFCSFFFRFWYLMVE